MVTIASEVRGFLEEKYPETYFRVFCRDKKLSITWNGGPIETTVRESMVNPLIKLGWTYETKLKRHDCRPIKLQAWEAETLTRSLCVAIGKQLNERIEVMANNLGISRSDLIRKAMWEYTEGKE